MMKQDKALKKIVSKSKPEGLSYGFENKIMKAIYLEAEKQSKRRFALSMALVSFVSLAIIAGAIYILITYYSVSFSFTMPQFSLSSEAKSTFWFSLYIALIVMFLLGLDTIFRQLKKKSE